MLHKLHFQITCRPFLLFWFAFSNSWKCVKLHLSKCQSGCYKLPINNRECDWMPTGPGCTWSLEQRQQGLAPSWMWISVKRNLWMDQNSEIISNLEHRKHCTIWGGVYFSQIWHESQSKTVQGQARLCFGISEAMDSLALQLKINRRFALLWAWTELTWFTSSWSSCSHSH